MALGFSLVITSPVPPPHKAVALHKAAHSKTQPAVKPPVTPQPPAVAQPETPPVATTAPVEAVAPVTPAPVVPTPACVTGYFTGNSYEDYIINYESGGNSCATNYLGCFGLMQACPGTPLRTACGGDPVCQLDWFWTYKVANDPKYGSWAAVYNHEIVYGWW